MNERKPDRNEKPQYIKDGDHHRRSRGGWGKWLWPLLLAIGVLAALSLCSREDRRTDEVIIEEPIDQNEVIEKQENETTP